MKLLNKIFNKIFNILFLDGNKNGLKILYFLGLDLYFYTLPIFYLQNRKPFTKLRRLRGQKKNPIIVYTVSELDGRFDRVNKVSENDDDLVVFQYPARNSYVEEYFFKSYARVPIGFYEDARQRYIKPDNLENRRKYGEHCKKLLQLLQKMTGKISFFCSGSNNDRWLVEMIVEAQAQGISWVVCEREGTSTDLGYEKEGLGFKISNSVVAHYHFLANDKHTKMFLDSKTDSVRMCKTIGDLDTDWWFHFDKTRIMKKFEALDKYKKVVLFLTFGERNYIEPTLFPERNDITWKPLLMDCENVLIDFAQKNPDILVIYRMGHKEDKNLAFLRAIKELKIENIIQSDRATSSFSDIAVRSDLIIGFQSTAMYEAMFTDKPILQVFWHILDFLNHETEILPIGNTGACKVATSPKSLSDYLDLFSKDSLAVDQKELAARKSAIEIMFVNADGKMAERFIDELKQLSR